MRLFAGSSQRRQALTSVMRIRGPCEDEDNVTARLTASLTGACSWYLGAVPVEPWRLLAEAKQTPSHGPTPRIGAVLRAQHLASAMPESLPRTIFCAEHMSEIGSGVGDGGSAPGGTQAGRASAAAHLVPTSVALLKRERRAGQRDRGE